MEIAIVGNGLPFGPETLKHKSLGGSETAHLHIAIELGKRGHLVNVFTPLPPPGEPDHVQSGFVTEDGVRFFDIAVYEQFITRTPVDMLVVSRDPRLASLPHQSKFTVLWMHDLATHSFIGQTLSQSAFMFDEIWPVSQWHAEQVHKVTGYPKSKIRPTRNGIVDVGNILPSHPHEPGVLYYGARPERGLWHLVRPGGIMERLPEYRLRVSMYAHFPEHMKPLYDACRARIEALPNVQFVGCLNQAQMRVALAGAQAYVYPTDFEETSCIIARECIEVETPMIYSPAGALPETVKDCGMCIPNLNPVGSDEWCQDFADNVRATVSDPVLMDHLRKLCSQRTDLYWDGVAQDWEARMRGAHSELNRATFTSIWSMWQDGDVIRAMKRLEDIRSDHTPMLKWLDDLMSDRYQFVHDATRHKIGAVAKHYARINALKTKDEGGAFQADHVGSPAILQDQRFQSISSAIADLPMGARILDYGCAEGAIVLNLAAIYPDYNFVAVDFDEVTLARSMSYAKRHMLDNVEFRAGGTETLAGDDQAYDALIAAEVLEHVIDPDAHLIELESKVKPGGRVVITVPYGPWEPDSWKMGRGHEINCQHIWHLEKGELRHWLKGKPGLQMTSLFSGFDERDIARGSTVVIYSADHQPTNGLRSYWETLPVHHRQTIAACLIAMNNEATIRHTLDSLSGKVQAVQVALAPSHDRTRQIIEEFGQDNPNIYVNIVDVPKIRAGEFGFDDARNASITNIDCDWILWIDTDEYLRGQPGKYARPNALDCCLIHQHHFSLDPRGAPSQIDIPGRMFRNNGSMKFIGKIHEHAEVAGGGPGYASAMADVDIGHTGYKDEIVRRARFERNFPLLVWDKEVNPDRKLLPYLWFRDIVHRIRYAHEQRDMQSAVALAEEAVQYFKDHIEELCNFGSGPQMSLAYLGEAMRFLQRGVPIKMSLEVNGGRVDLESCVEDIEWLTRVMKHITQPIIDKRKDRYFQ